MAVQVSSSFPTPCLVLGRVPTKADSLSESPQKQYLISRSPKAQVTFDLTLGLVRLLPFSLPSAPPSLYFSSAYQFLTTLSQGEVKLWYLRSWEYGLGDVSCWVDGRTYQKVRISGAWENRMNIGQIAEIATGLPSGAHQLHCVNEGNGEFRIVSVITSVVLFGSRAFVTTEGGD